MKETIKIQYIAIEKIKPYPNNAKKHKIEWIKKSIEEFKFDQPIVIDGDNEIIKGHGRYEAAKLLGLTEVPVILRDDLDKEAAAMSRLADNRSQQGEGFDIGKLKHELKFLNKKYTPEFMNAVGFKPSFMKRQAVDNIFTRDRENYDDIEDDMDDIIDDDEDDVTEYRIEQHILSIVLDPESYDKWSQYKEKCKKKTDTTAFINLLGEIES